jgi:hypothetical protein
MTKPTKRPIDPRMAPVIAAFAADRQVTYGGKGFGCTALKVKGKIFAMVSSKGQFVVKLPQARAAELVHRGQAEYFDAGRGRPLKTWLVLRGAPRLWVAIAREACRFVRSPAGQGY